MLLIDRLILDPAAPAWVVALIALSACIALAVYVWRGGPAPWLRGAASLFVLLAILQPQAVREGREPAPDAALILVDQSDSLALAGRREAARAAGDALAERLSREQGFDVRVREVRGGPDGTLIAPALADAFADTPRSRIAGAIIVTDGQAADTIDRAAVKDFGPAHVLIVGDPARGDRRLELISAPTFAIIGETMRIAARVDDPASRGDALVRVSIDGQEAARKRVPLNRPFEFSIAPRHRGRNMVVLDVEAGPQEIALSNNRAAFVVNGARDRLRVLLITGEPHQGARVWRNLLKSDPAVDLVHFTILRSPDKFDITPLDELSLIEYPTEELFERKLGQFDLIIFDRDEQRGILPIAYYGNIAQRIRDGGALLISAGTAEAGRFGVSSTPLAPILPSTPTGGISTQAYRPTPTALGSRHPVLRALPDPSHWGRWTRQIDARASQGEVLLSGAGGKPLLVIDRVGKGRVAQLWSDQIWLWARGYDGGGPHGEFLRRLVHWLMQEPELDEERLTLESDRGDLVASRSSLSSATPSVTVTGPSGAHTSVTMSVVSPGLWRGRMEAGEQGLYEAQSGDLRAFAAVGPLNPREASALTATPDLLRPLADATGGGVFLTGEDGKHVPEVRRVSPNDRAFGGDWLGLKRNAAYNVRTAVTRPLLPAWAWALLGLGVFMIAWRREAR